MSDRYWNDPEVLGKLGKAMGDVFDMPGGALPGMEGEEGDEEQGEEDEDEVPNLHSAASEGKQAGRLEQTACQQQQQHQQQHN